MNKTSTQFPGGNDSAPSLSFEQELTMLLNKHGMEAESNTNDYILARYLVACLDNFNTITKERAEIKGVPVRFQ